MSSCPLLVRLLARTGRGVPAVEVGGGGYRPQVAAFTPDADGCAVLAEPVRFARVPAHTAVGVEVSDRARTWVVPLAEPVDVGEGAEVLIPVGAVRVCCVAPPAATGGAADGGLTVPADGPADSGLSAVGTRLGNGAAARSQVDTHG